MRRTFKTSPFVSAWGALNGANAIRNKRPMIWDIFFKATDYNIVNVVHIHIVKLSCT